MRKLGFALPSTAALYLAFLAAFFANAVAARAAEPEKESATAPAMMSPAAMNAMVEDYCLMCHSDAAKTGGLTLESFDVSHPEENAEVAEKVIRKLRLGMMPPPIAPQPETADRQAFALSLETGIDRYALEHPNPGRRTFQRLNRSEYARAVRDMLALEVDVSAFLPPETISHGFDNIADVQKMSATLMEGYLRAAARISRDAVGDPLESATEETYRVSRRESQVEHVEGAPMGTRGGLSVVHNFPADGDYILKTQLHSTPTGFLYGLTAGDNEQLEISVNGVRVALIDIDPLMHESDLNGVVIESDPVHIRAGPQRISAAFIERYQGPVDDLMRPVEHTLADTTIGRAHGVTTVPHLRFFSINGPHNVTGISETPSRRRIFTCRPVSARDEAPCATEIVSRLSSQAYRRPVNENDVEGLMSFYQTGADEAGFEAGIRTALQAILASPFFVFRLEQMPDATEDSPNYRVSGVELASRLSFFIWGSAPDDELRNLGSQDALADPAVLSAQVDRMLAEPKADALATRFASQWLRLQDLDRLHPDYLHYPQYDYKLSEALKRETELFFEYLIREDRSALELLTADYTFANERLAKHYNLPNVTGPEFRRVSLEGTERRGILGHGSILTLTSIADRTSPVQRGKWVLEVLLGSPPPPPPPNIPDLEATQDAALGRVLSVREAMESHRANPACVSCHRVIDPLGLALENFDVTGAWRIKDNGNPIDASGELYDGTKMDGPTGLRDALLKHSDAVIMSFTESLMTYGLGRRVEYYDMPTVRAIASEAKKNDYRMSSFIRGVINSAAFQMARVERDEHVSSVEP